jgi:hypothetical protein
MNVCSVMSLATSLYLQYVDIKANEICRITNNTFGKCVLQNTVHRFVVIPLHFVYPSDQFYTYAILTLACLIVCDVLADIYHPLTLRVVNTIFTKTLDISGVAQA